MKKSVLIFLSVLAAVSCGDSGLDLQSKEELVVEGWIEDGHAPIVMVSSSLPVSSTPSSTDDIQDHILRYAEVYIDHNGDREYLTACLSDRLTIRSYFTSSTLRGEVGESYRLHVKWKNFVASSTCTIPAPPQIDTSWFEAESDSTSYVFKIRFRNDPSENKFYRSFQRVGSADTELYKSVSFSSLKGAQLGETVEASYMKPMSGFRGDAYFHQGDLLSLKLCCMEESMYDFWSSFTDASSGSGFSTLSTTVNLKGNMDGALGYWAGYGIDIVETVCGD